MGELEHIGQDIGKINAMALSGALGKEIQKAHERRNKRIAEIGEEAYHVEYEEVRRKILYEAELKAKAEYTNALILKAESKELTEKEKKILLKSDIETRVKYIKLLLRKSNLGKKFFTRTFETFEVNPENEPAHEACYNLASGKRTKGILISGANGIGKTHLAAAIVNYLAEKGTQVYFQNIVDLKDELMNNFRNGTEKIMGKMEKCQVLVLDDLGAERSKENSTFIEELIYKIVNRAYEDERSIVITTNLENEDIIIRYGDRTMSRLLDMCDFIHFDSRDRRGDFEPTDELMPFAPYKD